MKLVIAVNALGTCKRSSAWSRSRTSVVATSRPVAATPNVPLIRMFHAPHKPGTDNDIPSTSVCGLVPMIGKEHRERDEGQLDRQALAEDREGDAGDRCQHHEDRGVHAEGPERFAGVATTAKTNATVATSLHSGASAWIGDLPSTNRGRCCPAPTVSLTP